MPDTSETTRTCSTCLTAKEDSEFSWKVKDVKRSGVCKECHRAYRRQHYQDNKQKYIDKARKWEIDNGGKLAVRYNLTPEKLNTLSSKYDGLCWICQERPWETVDHNHLCCNKPTSCGNCVRGLLCSSCNKGIGFLRDRIDILDRAKVYLEENIPYKH